MTTTQHFPFTQATSTDPSASLIAIHSEDHATAFLEALRARHARAERRLVEEQRPRIERVLVHLLGTTNELDDHCQDVLVRTFSRIGEVRDPKALSSFVRAIAVNVAREVIKKKRRWRWITFHDPTELPDAIGAGLDAESREALRAVYHALDQLTIDERVALTLRFIEGMDLEEVASAQGVSLATIKRRLSAAKANFLVQCRSNDELWDWVEKGARWP